MQAEIGLALQLVVGLVFLLSGLTKVLDLAGFSDGLEQYDILPGRLVRPIGVLIVLGELGIAASHLSGIFLDGVAPIAVGMLLVFMFAVARAIKRGDRVPCLCFGSGRAELVSTSSFARLVLLVLAEIGIWLSLSSSQRPPLLHELSASDSILVICAASLSLVAVRWFFALPDLYRLRRKTSAEARVCLGLGRTDE